MDLKRKIREIPNWPIKGVNFKDITTLLQDKKLFKYVIDEMAKPFQQQKIDKIVAIDARGFILAAPLAYKLKTGVSLVRKKGKLPHETIAATYIKEYGPDTLTMHKDTIRPGDKVLIVDDLLATGGTLGASIKLIEKLNGKIIGISLIIDLSFLGGSKKFKKYNLHYLVSYDQEYKKICPAKGGVKVGIIGGSGLDNPEILKNFREISVKTPFGKPSSTLTCGKIGNTEVVILARHGKKHTIIPTHVPYRANIWALQKVGCTHILATTACGSLREKFKPSDIIFIDQFIDNTKHRILTFFENKLVHTPMAEPFDQNLRKCLIKSAKELKIRHHPQGTMITIEGPRFSTKAESHMFRGWGADLINMSTVPEVILANELEIPYQTIAMSTDYDCWKDNEESVTFEIILKRMADNADKVKKLIINLIKSL